jgi:membrane-bound lytic murein transglycosylase B
VTGTDQDPTATLDAAPVSPAVPVGEAPTDAEPIADPDTPIGDEPAATPERRTRRRSRRAHARDRRRRAGRAVRRWATGPGGRFVLPTLAILGLLAAAAVGGRYLVPAVAPAVVAQPSDAPTRSDVGTAPSQAPDDTGPSIDPQPTDSADPGASPSASARPQDTLAAWAARMSPVVGVPQIALQAYGFAQLRAQQTLPGCHLTWTTLAGIGKIESDHGREGGAFVLPDGRALPPIVGAPLDGTGGRALVKDTDHGLLDGDPVYDRAVGPMQFIPDTWGKYQVDADGDGVSDPNDINDASLAAADYLCAGGRNLSDGPSWWSAVLSYNAVRAYAVDVFNAANDYGTKSRTVA